MGYYATLQQQVNSRRKKKDPAYYGPEEGMSPEEAQGQYASFAPGREEAGAAARAAATRLGAPQSPLLAMLRQRAIEGLNQGGDLSNEEIRAANQTGLASWSSRGLGRSPGAGFSRMLSRIAASNARRRERESFAGSVAGLEDTAARTDIAALGQTSETAYRGVELGEDIRRFGINRADTAAQGATNFGMDLYTTKANAAAARAAGQQSMLGGIASGVGGIAAAAIIH